MEILSHIIIALLVGIIAGFISSMPPGPTEAWIARRVLTPRHQSIGYFIFGIIVCDLLYAFIGFWGYFKYFKNSGYSHVVSFVGCGALVILGIYDFIKYRKEPVVSNETEIQDKKLTRVDDVAAGFFLCGFNPVFIVFWIFVAANLASAGIKLNLLNNAMMLVGIAIGDVVWYILFSHFVKLTAKKVHPKTLHYIQQAMSLGIALFGGLGLYEIFNSTTF